MSKNRAAFVATALISLGTLAVAVWSWARPPALIRGLRSLPEVAKVEYSGTASNYLTVIHLRDWHYVPKELAELEGLDFEEHLADVEKVQADQLAVMRHLIKAHGVGSVYSEGLSEESAPDLRVRVQILRDMAKLEKAARLDTKEKSMQRMFRLEVGVPGQLLERGEIDEVLPLEVEAALQAAKPVDGGKIVFDATKVDARRRAMVGQLPAQGLVVMVLGGSHDLTGYLPEGTRYIRVTVKGYPGE